MASNAFSGIGTKFYVWSADQAAYVLIAEINSISGPSMSRETIDVTSLDSTGGYREFIASIRTGGVVSLSMNFTRDTYDVFKSGFNVDTLRTYQIILPDTDGTVFEFTGLVTELPVEIAIADKVTADVTIQISGAPVLGNLATETGPYSDTSDSDAYLELDDAGFSGFEVGGTWKPV